MFLWCASIAVATAAATPANFAIRHPLPGIPQANRTFTAGLLDVKSPVGQLSVFHAFADHPDPAAPLIVVCFCIGTRDTFLPADSC